MKEPHRLQAERKAALEAAIEEAARLSQLAAAKGEGCNLAEPFANRRFEFLLPEIERMVARFLRLKEAQTFCAARKKVVRMAA